MLHQKKAHTVHCSKMEYQTTAFTGALKKKKADYVFGFTLHSHGHTKREDADSKMKKNKKLKLMPPYAISPLRD